MQILIDIKDEYLPIKGVKDIRLHIDRKNDFYYADTIINRDGKYREDVPITVLHDHGKLIDADELHAKSKELYKTVQISSERKMGYLIAMNQLVIDAPTVLEASKE